MNPLVGGPSLIWGPYYEVYNELKNEFLTLNQNLKLEFIILYDFEEAELYFFALVVWSLFADWASWYSIDDVKLHFMSWQYKW